MDSTIWKLVGIMGSVAGVIYLCYENSFNLYEWPRRKKIALVLSMLSLVVVVLHLLGY